VAVLVLEVGERAALGVPLADLGSASVVLGAAAQLLVAVLLVTAVRATRRALEALRLAPLPALPRCRCPRFAVPVRFHRSLLVPGGLGSRAPPVARV
jgi:hypothetical protein